MTLLCIFVIWSLGFRVGKFCEGTSQFRCSCIARDAMLGSCLAGGFHVVCLWNKKQPYPNDDSELVHIERTLSS